MLIISLRIQLFSLRRVVFASDCHATERSRIASRSLGVLRARAISREILQHNAPLVRPIDDERCLGESCAWLMAGCPPPGLLRCSSERPSMPEPPAVGRWAGHPVAGDKKYNKHFMCRSPEPQRSIAMAQATPSSAASLYFLARQNYCSRRAISRHGATMRRKMREFVDSTFSCL